MHDTTPRRRVADLPSLALDALERRIMLATYPVTTFLLQPLESLVTGSEPVEVTAAPAGLSDEFTFDAFTRGKAGVVVRPLDPSLRLRATLGDATATAAGPGESVVLQNVTLPASADAVRVDVLAGSGDYRIEVAGNALLELEDRGGAANDEVSTAEALDGSALSIGGGQRMAVRGKATAGSADLFKFDVASAGRTVSLALGGPARFEVLDAGGAVVAGGATGSATADGGFVRDYRPATAGAHYVRVLGRGEGDYTLVVTTGLTLGLEPDRPAGAVQTLRPGAGVLGFAGDGAGTIEDNEYNNDIGSSDDADSGRTAINGGGRIGYSGDVDLFRLGEIQSSDRLTIDLDLPDFGQAALRLFDEFGNELAFSSYEAAPDEIDPDTGGSVGNEGDAAYIDYSDGYSGELYLGVSDANDTDYDPFTGEDTGEYGGTFDYELYVSFNGAEPDVPGDSYGLLVAPGETLAISAEPATNLFVDLAIELFDENGGLVASADDAIAPGASLTYEVPAGTPLGARYTLRVTETGGFGAYALDVSGANLFENAADPVSLAFDDPYARLELGGVASFPREVTLTLGDAARRDSLDLSDLTIVAPDGTTLQAAAVREVAGNVFVFDTSGLNRGEGLYTLRVAEGALVGADGSAINGIERTFNFLDAAPRVTESSLAPGDLVDAGAFEYRAAFSRPLLDFVDQGFFGIVVLDGEDVRVADAFRGGEVDGALIEYAEPEGGDPFLRWAADDIADGVYTLRLVADKTPGVFNDGSGGAASLVTGAGDDPNNEGIQSNAGVGLDGAPSFPGGALPSGDGTAGDDFTVSFVVDAANTTAMPAFAAVGPVQAGVYRTTAAGAIHDGGDVDRFTFELPGGGRSTDVLLDIAGGEGRLRLTLLDAAGNVVAEASADADGGEVSLPARDLPAGAYEVEIASADGGAAAYDLRVALAAAQADAGDSAATAADLSATFGPLVSTAGRYGAVGEVSSQLVETTLATDGGAELFVPELVEFDATGTAPVGDVRYDFVSGAANSNLRFIRVSFEGLLTRTVVASAGSSQESVSISPEQWRRLADDGVIRVSVRAFGDAPVSVTERKPVKGDADVYRVPLSPGSEATVLVENLDGGLLSVTFEDADGNAVAGAARPGTSSASGRQRVARFVAGDEGQTFVRVEGEGRYVLSVARDATTRGGNRFAPATPLGPSGRGLAALNQQDNFADFLFFVRAGDTLALETATPDRLDGNTLDPFLRLYAPSGAQIASDADGGPGVNAKLNAVAPADGTYRVRVQRTAGAGEAVLTVSGASPEADNPSVIATFPADGGKVSNLSQLLVRFDEPIVAADLSPASLSISGGASVTAAEVIDATTIRFALAGGGGGGGDAFAYTLAGGAVVDLAGNANRPYAGVLEIDRTAPRLVGTTPTQAATGFRDLSLIFDDAIDPAGVDRNSLVSFTGPDGEDLSDDVFAVFVDFDDPERITISFASQRALGDYTVVLRGTFLNTAGLRVEGDVTATVRLANADLALASADAPDTITLGQAFDVTYRVENRGTDPAAGFRDAIYLSDDDTFGNGDRRLDQFDPGVDPLPAGAGYDQTRSVTAALDTRTPPGTYWLFVVTDDSARISEPDESDNVRRIGPATVVAPALPNLVVTNVVGPATAVSGDEISVSYTITNAGDADFAGSFTDRLSLSDDALVGGDRFLRDAPFTGTLAAGASITRTASVRLPVDAQGDRWYVVQVDRFNQVEEFLNEGDNVAVSDAPTAVTLAPQVDLVPSNVTLPASARSGETITVRWTLSNLGDEPFSGSVSERVLLSDDDALGNGDAVIATSTFTGEIAVGASVQRSATYVIPIDFEGRRFAVVNTDVFNNVVEVGGEDNNVAVSAETIDITLSDQPNLVVRSVIAPDTIFSGQRATITWQVENAGAGPTTVPVWYDQLYLSTNATFEPGDRYLGQKINGSFLNPGQAYTSTLDVTIPREVEGDLFVIVVADGSRRQPEVGFEDDNARASDVIAVTLTPPADLQVSLLDVPSNAFSARPLTFRYAITNEGQQFAPAWTDAAYLSADDTFDSGDLRLGTFGSGEGLAAGATRLFERGVSIPADTAGEFFLILRTDFFNNVFEGPFEANNDAADAVRVLLTPPADLVTTITRSPAEADSRRSVTVDYSVANEGTTSPNRSAWTDALYVSLDPVFDAADRRIGSVGISRPGFAPGSSYDASISGEIPQEADGDFYLIVRSDSFDQVFELDTANNADAALLRVIPNLPNLVAESADAPAAANTGTAFAATFTVANRGVGDTRVSNWVDRLYLSVDDQIGGDRLLASRTHSGRLDPGETYDARFVATIPDDVVAGEYFLIFQSDQGRQVFESNEGDNNRLASITVMSDLPDLRPATLTASPQPLVAGRAGFASYTVENLGRTLAAGYYTDRLYLSRDDILDGGDTTLDFEANRDGAVAGEGYSGTFGFTVPFSAEGDYFLILQVDNSDLVREGAGELNNVLSVPASVARGPEPDLTVTSVTGPRGGFGGRLVDVSWTVANVGDDDAGDTFDTVYLSADESLDSADRALGSFPVSGVAAGQSRTRSASVRLPLGVAGDFFLIVAADTSRRVAESNETNNAAADAAGIRLTPAPPVDLVAGTISLPGDAFAGQDATLTYSVTNAGPSDLFGQWSDSLYVSPDPVWDPSDPLFAERAVSFAESAPLLPGASYSRTVTAPLPGLPTGDYFVILRSDIRNVVPETNEDNNLAASVDDFEITIPTLSLGETITLEVDAGRFLYYRVNVPEGQTLLVDVTADRGATELYVAEGRVATRNDFDEAFDRPNARDQRVIVGDTASADYFITALARNDSTVTLRARLVPFGLIETDLGVGGDAGDLTVELVGARFDRSLNATLLRGGREIPAERVFISDATRAYATFDLAGAPLGEYAVRLDKLSTGESATYTAALDVVDVPDLPPVAGTAGALSGPGAVRNTFTSFRVSPLWGNDSLNDVPAPVLFFESTRRFGFEPSSPSSRSGITFVGVSRSGPAGVLRPGQSQSASFYVGTQANDADIIGGRGAAIESQLSLAGSDPTAAYDWEQLRETLTLSELDEAENRVAFDALVRRSGPTWGDLAAAVSRGASRLVAPDRLVSLEEALAPELEAAYAAVTTSLSGRVSADSLKIDIAGRAVLLRDVETGRSYAATTYRDGSFFAADIEAGTYEVRVEGALLATPVSVAVTAGAAVEDATVELIEGATIRGTFTAAATGEGLAGEVRVIDETGLTVATARTRDDGTFTVGGLVTGNYTAVFEAPGFARTFATAEVTSLGDTVSVAATVGVGAAIRGSIVPDAEALGFVVSARPSDPADVGGLYVGETDGTEFNVDSLRPGEYTLTLRSDGFVPLERVVTVAAGQTLVLENLDLIAESVVSGRVLDTAGNPAGGIAVGAYRNGREVSRDVSGADGAFRIGELAAGTYEVRAVSNLPLTTSETVTLGDEQRVGGREVVISTGATLRGRVTLADGAAATGRLVLLFGSDGLPDGTAITDDAGRFEVEGLLVGRYVARVQGGSAEGVEIAQGEADASVELVAASAIGTLTGRATTADGAPVAWANVVLDGDAGPVAYGRTDDAGFYRFDVLSAGEFDLSVVAVEGTFKLQRVLLDAGASVVDFVAGSATLRVNFAGGPSFAIVGLQAADAAGRVVATGFGRGNAFADFDGLAPGQYVVTYADPETDAAGRAEVQVVAGANSVTVTPAATGTITATVLGFDGQPAPAALAVRNAATGEFFTAYAEDGTASLDGVAAGTYDVLASVFGGGVRVASVTVAAGGTLDLGTLQAAEYDAAATGRVVDADGQPVAGAEVLLRDAGGNVVSFALSDGQGRFELPAPAGDYEVLVFRPGAAAAVVAVTLAASSTANVGDVVSRDVAAAVLAPEPSVDDGGNGGAAGLVAPGLVAPGDGAFGEPGAAAIPLLSQIGNYTYELIRNVQLGLPELPELAQPDLSRIPFVPAKCRDECRPALDAANRAFAEYRKVYGQYEGFEESYEIAVKNAALGYITGITEAVKFGADLILAVEGLAAAGLVKLGNRGGQIVDELVDLASSSEARVALQIAFDSINAVNGLVQGIKSVVDNITAAAQPTASWLDNLKAAQSSAALLVNNISNFVTDSGLQDLASTVGKLVTATRGNALAVADDIASVWIKAIDNARDAIVEIAGDRSGKDFFRVGEATKFLEGLGAVADFIGPVTDFIGLFVQGGLVKRFEADLDAALAAKREAEFQRGRVNAAEARFISAKARLLACIRDCEKEDEPPMPRDPKDPLPTRVVGSSDPNDIVGPAGFGDDRFVAADEVLPYRIRFENDPVFATAPAQFVRIETQLDAALEWRSFRLGDFGFANLDVTVPEGLSVYQTRVDLTAERGFVVDVTAGFDVTTGLAFWEFETIDPATGRAPLDPLVGLLPVNDGSGAGEGYVDYSIRARGDAATGVVVRAQAEIVFDAEAPLRTPEWFNTLDAGRPTSEVEALPAEAGGNEFTVTWAGGDAAGGSGLAGYDVYVSVDGGAYRPFLLNTTATSAPFAGESGRSYRFFTVARDNAGNDEAAPAVADATTRTPGSAVAGRFVFYNNSGYDGRDPAANAADDAAIATDKVALLPGGLASFENYTGYSRGLNGIMIDVERLPSGGGLSAADFMFRAGNSDLPGAWADAPAPLSVTVRRGAGVNGSDRVTLVWADGAVSKRWLQVTVLPTPRTGLSAADVFYFGNAPGESGNSDNDAAVTLADVLTTRLGQSGFGGAAITSRLDHDRDGDVDLGDVLVARLNQSGFDPLRLIDLRGPAASPLGGGRGLFGGLRIGGGEGEDERGNGGGRGAMLLA